jgi:hypothetical protein
MTDQQAILHFPVAGIDVSGPFSDQRPKPLPNETDENGNPVYGRTTPVAKNVRVTEASSLRRRGGSRPGTEKYIPARVAGTEFVVQELAQVVVSGTEGVG